MHVTIIGCGQLARLLALAGKPMGIDFTFVAIDDESTRCVRELGSVVHWSRQVSAESLLEAIGRTDVVTTERENVDINLLLDLSMQTKVFPRPESVAICKNRVKEKMALSQLNISSTPWLAVNDAQGLIDATEYFDYPLVVKSVEHGYDGKNQWRIRDRDALNNFINNIEELKCIVEPTIEFDAEVSLIAARSLSGEIKFYSLTENRHAKGILRTSLAPADFIEQQWLLAVQSNMTKLMEKWQYIGVLTMELFVTSDGFMVNELAPRIHNSGHWTENSAATSQFENHLRAILDLPLGSTENQGYAAMVNILGTDFKADISSLPERNVHLYDKIHRPGRKLGHINVNDSHRNGLLNKVKIIEQMIYSNNNQQSTFVT